MARRKDSGFALLLVFLMAAVVAIMLYAELPRVAFQSQRQKEQLLMERGEQYKRAIQMYYVAAKRWPSTLEDLDTFQNRHFLRHKYVDPMTGKAEWRLIHTNGQILTDSVLTKNQGGAGAGRELTYIDSIVGTASDGTATARPQDRRRASEGGAEGQYIPGVSPMPVPAGSNPPDPNQANLPGQPNPNQQPGAGTTPGMPGTPGNIAGGANVPGGPTMPAGAAQPTGQPPGAPGAPGQPPVNPIAGGAMPSGVPGQDGQQPPPNAAASLIGRILTTPNPQGFRIAQQSAQAGNSNTVGGGGIAGVASKAEMEGIMVYNERTAYNEWEFVFDQTKLRAPTQLTPQGTGPQQPGRTQPQQGSQFQIGGPGGGGVGGPGMGGPGMGGGRMGGPSGGTNPSGNPGGAMGGTGAALPSTYRPGRP